MSPKVLSFVEKENSIATSTGCYIDCVVCDDNCDNDECDVRCDQSDCESCYRECE